MLTNICFCLFPNFAHFPPYTKNIGMYKDEKHTIYHPVAVPLPKFQTHGLWRAECVCLFVCLSVCKSREFLPFSRDQRLGPILKIQKDLKSPWSEGGNALELGGQGGRGTNFFWGGKNFFFKKTCLQCVQQPKNDVQYEKKISPPNTSKLRG